MMIAAVRARDRHGGRKEGKGGRGGGTGGGIRLPARSETTLPPKSALRIIFLDAAVEVAGAAPPPVVAAALVCCTLRQHLLLPPFPLSPIHREILPQPHHGSHPSSLVFRPIRRWRGNGRLCQGKFCEMWSLFCAYSRSPVGRPG